LLIEAFSRLDHLECALWLLGKGPLEMQVKSEVKRRGLGGKVKFLGFDPIPYSFMAQADCLVLSSDFEGFGNVITEALACGLPAISTDCLSGPREVLAPSTDFNVQVKEEIELAEYGLLVPVGDAGLLANAMEQMMTDEGLRTRYRNSALTRAKEFETEKIADQYRSILAEDNAWNTTYRNK
ncbi:MAG: glycosyltransferase, partial [Bacteroidia bacterium]|nr:glycosyltransferase [Bacteroidia bacterium]